MNRNGMNLVELAREIMRRADAKRDFVADTTDLVFESSALSIGNAGAFPLTDHAHGQIDDVALDGELAEFLHHSHGSAPSKVPKTTVSRKKRHISLVRPRSNLCQIVKRGTLHSATIYG